jgi:hypothetical protein
MLTHNAIPKLQRVRGQSKKRALVGVAQGWAPDHRLWILLERSMKARVLRRVRGAIMEEIALILHLDHLASRRCGRKQMKMIAMRALRKQGWQAGVVRVTTPTGASI